MTAVIGKPKPTAPLRLTVAAMQNRNACIWDREQHACAMCRRGILRFDDKSIHHRLPKSRSGGDEVSNGVLLCGSGTTGCHGWVHANPADATLIGFMIPSGADPMTVPIRHALYGVVTFDDTGRTIGVSQTVADRVETAFSRIMRERRATR